MARAKRWTIPFKSLNGVACRVDIYNEGWTGSVTELSINNANAPGVAGADTFFYEEGNSDNLLDFIRIKTGYINLVETTFGGLNALMPKSDMENYVEFYYGSELNFTGYIQTFNPSNDWVSSPRKFRIPVKSPLGLIDGIRIDTPSTPSPVSIGTYLARILVKLNAGYTKVIMPDIDTDVTAKIYSMLIDTWNEEYNYDIDDTQNPITHGYLKTILEGICNMCGWILHDTPDALVFTCFDYTGKYSYWTSDNLYSGIGKTQVVATVPELQLSSFFENILKGSKEKYIGTLNKLTIDYGESSESEELEFKRVKYDPSVVTAAGLLLIGNSVEFNRFSDTVDLGSTGGPSSSTQTMQAWLFGIQDNDTWKTNEKLIFYTGNDSSNNGKVVFRVRLYTHWLFKLSGRLSWGPDTKHLGHDGFQGDFYLAYDFGSTPNSTPDDENPASPYVTYVNHSTGEFSFRFDNYQRMLNHTCVEFAIYFKDGFPGYNLVFSLDELKLEQALYNTNKYTDTVPNTNTINLDSGSSEDAGIELLFNQRKATGYNNDEHHLLGNFVNADYNPSYAYLGKNQQRLELKIKRKATPPDTMYLAHWMYHNKTFRMIATKFYPCEDEYMLILHYPMT